jgi:hypothetical protein
MAPPTIDNQYVSISTSVLLVNSSNYYNSNIVPVVLLSSLNTFGRVMTVRDNDGGAGINPIIVSTTNNIRYQDFTTKLQINQAYGYITFSPFSSNQYNVLNTYAFQQSVNLPGTAATVVNLTADYFKCHCNISAATIAITSSFYCDSASLFKSTISSIQNIGVGDSVYINNLLEVKNSISTGTLHVKNSALFFSNVGININNPVYRLDIGGDASVRGNLYTSTLAVNNYQFPQRNVLLGGRSLIAGTGINFGVLSSNATSLTQSTIPLDSINDIGYNGQLYIAVGQRAGVNTTNWSTSLDGKLWTNNSPQYIIGSTFTINSIGWNGTVWVAGGFNSQSSTAPSIAYSYDGNTWLAATQTALTNISVNRIAWNGSMWLAVGNSSTSTTILYSYNGINWTALTTLDSGLTGGFVPNDVVWNGKFWCMIGESVVNNPNSVIATSTNGLNWTYNQDPSISLTALHYATTLKIAWNGNYFLASGDQFNNPGTPPSSKADGSISISYDGIVWKPVLTASSPNAYIINQFTWTGSQWIGVGYDPDNGEIVVSSPDGWNWTVIYNYYYLGPANIPPTGVLGMQVLKTCIAIGYSDVPIGSVYGRLAVDTLSTIGPAHFNDSLTVGTSIPISTPTLAVYPLYNTVGVNCNAPRYDLDVNNTIHATNLLINNSISSLTMNTGQLIASSIGLNIGQNTPRYILDISGSMFTSSMVANIVLTSTMNSFITSTNQLLLSSISLTNYSPIKEALWVAGAAGPTALGSILYSTDGSNWNPNVSGGFAPNGGGFPPYGGTWGLAGNGSMFVAVGQNGTTLTPTAAIQYSMDGSNWLPANTAVGFTDGSFTRGLCVVWGNNMWVAGGIPNTFLTSNTSIQYSADGINWSNVTSGGFSNQCRAIAYNNASSYQSILYVAAGVGATAAQSLQYSSDGLNWLASVSGGFGIDGTVAPFAVIYGGGKWVAGGRITAASGLGSNFAIQYSTNGSNWLPSDSSANSFDVNRGDTIMGLAYSSSLSLWVAVGFNALTGAPIIKRSPNGQTWTSVSQANFSGFASGSIRAVSWNGSFFVATGTGTTQATTIQYSTDGTTWSASVSGAFAATRQPLTVTYNTVLSKTYNNNLTIRGNTTIGTTTTPNTFTLTGEQNIVNDTLGFNSVVNGPGFLPAQLNIKNYTGVLRIGNYYTPGVMAAGVIQSVDTNLNTDSSRNLLLNPKGGYVGINCNVPAYQLDINGNINVGGSIGTTTVQASNVNAPGYSSNLTPIYIAAGVTTTFTSGIGSIMYSYNGFDWFSNSNGGFTPISGGTGNTLAGTYGVGGNGKMWVAVGQDKTTVNSSAAIQYSYDGIYWNQSITASGFNNGTFARGTCVVWGNNMWVAGGIANTVAGCNTSIQYSYDAINWYPVISGGFTGSVKQIIFNNTSIGTNGYIYIACGGSAGGNTSLIQYSRDGLNWSNSTTNNYPFSATVVTIAFNGSRWLAAGDSSSGTTAENIIQYSTDGLNWLATTSGIAANDVIYSIAWGNNTWVAVGYNLSAGLPLIKTSPTGMVWTSRITSASALFPSFSEIKSVIFDGTNFRIIGSMSPTSLIVSSDGITWSSSVTTGTIPNSFLTLGYNNVRASGYSNQISINGIANIAGDTRIKGDIILGPNVGLTAQGNYSLLNGTTRNYSIVSAGDTSIWNNNGGVTTEANSLMLKSQDMYINTNPSFSIPGYIRYGARIVLQGAIVGPNNTTNSILFYTDSSSITTPAMVLNTAGNLVANGGISVSGTLNVGGLASLSNDIILGPNPTTVQTGMPYTEIKTGTTQPPDPTNTIRYSGQSLRFSAQNMTGSFGATFGGTQSILYGARIDLEAANFGPLGTNSRILFYTGGTASLRIPTMTLDYDGNLGVIGNIITSKLLTVGADTWHNDTYGNLRYYFEATAAQRPGAFGRTFFSQPGGGYSFTNTTQAQVLSIDNTGNLVANGDVTAFSDKRLKTNIVQIQNSLSTINELTGVYYNRIDSLSNRHIGFVAQDIEAVLPEVVHTGTDEEKTKSIAYGNITALLLEGIKELSAKYDALKQEFDSLKSQVNPN